MLAMLALVSRMQARITELESQRRTLVEDHRHLAEQLELAARIQADLQPKPVAFPGLEVISLSRPLDRVSGDLHDFVRYEDDYLGISLADVSGHGMPASLLTALLRRAFRGENRCCSKPRPRAPKDVLGCVNAEMLSVDLTDCQFVTGLHAVYDRAHRTLSFARGGAPYPILLRRNQSPRQLITNGPLLGALPDARFDSHQIELAPGDAILFYTDGVEALLACGAAHNGIAETRWFEELSADTLADAIADIEHRLDTTHRADWAADDVTVIAVRATD